MVKKVDKYGLTVRERRFADEYIANGRNATQAYKSISPNAKDTTCASKGYEWIRKGEVSEYIKTKTIERLDSANLMAEDVLNRLIEIAFGRIQKGSSKQIDNLTGEVLKDINYEYIFDNDNQVKALELLGKNMAMWTDKHEVNANVQTSKLDSILNQLTDDGDG